MPLLERDVVEQHAGFEIVGAVENDVDAVGQLADIRVIDVGHQRLDRDLRIDLSQLGRRGDRLGQVRRRHPPRRTGLAAASC